MLRVRVAFLLMLLFAIAIIVRIGNIQFVEGAKWAKIADNIGLQYRKVDATRGNIYSDNGSLMATSLPFYRVAFDPSIADDALYKQDIDSLAYLLSRHFGDRSAHEYKRKINNARVSGREYLVLNHELIDYQEKKEFSKWPIFREGRLGGGVLFEKVEKRFRPFSHLGGRTIGYVNENGDGAGLEYSFDEYLSGADGEALFQKMAGGNWKPIYDGSEIRPEEGLDVETTIDINLQDVAESALLRALISHQADYGTVIVMEVETGEIKAISNLKGYEDGRYRAVYNYAVQGLTEPGSTFKLASMIALLEDSSLQPTDSIDTGDGEYKFYDRTMRDHKLGGYGTITVQRAFEVSSNIGISKLVENQFGLHPQRFIDYIASMHLTRPLGFQMVGEGVPYVKKASDPSWSGTTLPWMSIGYELKLTPLHLLAFFNAVANNGKMIEPIIVKRIKKADKTIKVFNAEVLDPQLCSKETLEEVKDMLEGVVERGTALNIKNSYYKIAGKTGTAQIIENGRYTRKYNTSFAGYFPADRPKYSCIVMISDPKGYNQYGSDVSAPVFKEIADKIYARDLEMHAPYKFDLATKENPVPEIRAGHVSDVKVICNELGIPSHTTSTDEWVRAKTKDHAVALESNEISMELVPDVRGMTLRDALYLLENRGLKVQINGHGRVVTQSQPAGSKVQAGTEIILKLS